MNRIYAPLPTLAHLYRRHHTFLCTPFSPLAHLLPLLPAWPWLPLKSSQILSLGPMAPPLVLGVPFMFPLLALSVGTNSLFRCLCNSEIFRMWILWRQGSACLSHWGHKCMCGLAKWNSSGKEPSGLNWVCKSSENHTWHVPAESQCLGLTPKPSLPCGQPKCIILQCIKATGGS